MATEEELKQTDEMEKAAEEVLEAIEEGEKE